MHLLSQSILLHFKSIHILSSHINKYILSHQTYHSHLKRCMQISSKFKMRNTWYRSSKSTKTSLLPMRHFAKKLYLLFLFHHKSFTDWTNWNPQNILLNWLGKNKVTCCNAKCFFFLWRFQMWIKSTHSLFYNVSHKNSLTLIIH